MSLSVQSWLDCYIGVVQPLYLPTFNEGIGSRKIYIYITNQPGETSVGYGMELLMFLP
jgi:hypothetical protein